MILLYQGQMDIYNRSILLTIAQPFELAEFGTCLTMYSTFAGQCASHFAVAQYKLGQADGCHFFGRVFWSRTRSLLRPSPKLRCWKGEILLTVGPNMAGLKKKN